MLISLVVLRLEVADDCQIPSIFETYYAPNFDRPTLVDKDSKPSYALVTKQSPSSSKEHTPPKGHSFSSKENFVEYRGSRENCDITLEYLSVEDIQRMEKTVDEMEANQKKTENKRKRQGSKSMSPETSNEASPREADQPSPRETDQPSPRESDQASPREDDHGSYRQLRRNGSHESTNPDCDGPGPTPGTPGRRQKSHSPPGRDPNSVHFISGNPSVDLVKGILHLYKDSQMTSLEKDVPRSEMLCMMAIPAAYTIHDLIKFTAPLNDSMESMQVLRGAVRNQYMLLIKFKNQPLADEFYSYFNGRPFNSIEEDVCHLVYVAKVEMVKESEGGSLPIPGFTELPHCPVCLEKMEEAVDGVLTVLCNHSFHVSCLAQWGDTTCPVCRYTQTPEEVPDQLCMQCGSQESLWICLICGCVGCGRYVGLHAYKHFQETNHTYAMQLGTNRVWDYAGDNYVHRLAQNKSDGKLVQVVEGNNAVQEEKFDSITLEYTYLLTTQLESQRRYFEEKIIEETKEANLRVNEVEDQLNAVKMEKGQVSTRLNEVVKEKQALEKKCTQMHSKLGKVLSELQDEKDMNKCLMENQQLWQQRVAALETTVKDLTQSKEKEIGELREQLRDVMFYLEAQNKLSSTVEVSQEEIQDGQVIVGAAATTPESSGKKRSKKRR